MALTTNMKKLSKLRRPRSLLPLMRNNFRVGWVASALLSESSPMKRQTEQSGHRCPAVPLPPPPESLARLLAMSAQLALPRAPTDGLATGSSSSQQDNGTGPAGGTKRRASKAAQQAKKAYEVERVAASNAWDP